MKKMSKVQRTIEKLNKRVDLKGIQYGDFRDLLGEDDNTSPVNFRQKDYVKSYSMMVQPSSISRVGSSLNSNVRERIENINKRMIFEKIINEGDTEEEKQNGILSNSNTMI